MKAVSIINYNCPQYLPKQIRSIKKYYPNVEIVVTDNSRGDTTLDKICDKHGVRYLRWEFSDGDYSRHHASALNAMWTAIKDDYDAILILDHDTFPFGDNDIFKRINDKALIGVPQIREQYKYMLPNYLAINTRKLEDYVLNFMPIEGLDTGGQLCNVLNGLPPQQIEYVKHEIVDYEVIDNTWFHFIKGSNWNDNPNHEKRIKRLFKELEKRQK